MIGSARPKSLNEVKESLSYMANRPARSCEQRNRGVLRHPAWPGLSVGWRNGMGGAKFVLVSFVHAARKPEIGSFIRTGHMTGADGLFKAVMSLIAPIDE